MRKNAQFNFVTVRETRRSSESPPARGATYHFEGVGQTEHLMITTNPYHLHDVTFKSLCTLLILRNLLNYLCYLTWLMFIKNFISLFTRTQTTLLPYPRYAYAGDITSNVLAKARSLSESPRCESTARIKYC